MDIGKKIINLAAGAVSGVAANAIIDLLWEAGYGEVSPRKVGEEDLPLKQLVVFALVSGSVTALLHSLSQRQASKFYEKSVEEG